MKSRTNISAFLGVALLGVSVTCNAEAPYFGANLVNTTYEFNSINGSFSSSDSGFRLYAGLPMNESISVEAAWIDQGDASSDYTDWGGGVESISSDGIQLSALGRLPLQTGVNLFGRIGFYMWNIDYTDVWTGGGQTFNVSDDGMDLFYGFGVDFMASNNLSIRAEYNIVSLDVSGESVDANNFSVGVSLHQ